MPTKCFGTQDCAKAWPARMLTMLAVLSITAGAWANTAFYTGSAAADLNAPTGSSISFNTNTGVLSLSGGATAPVSPDVLHRFSLFQLAVRGRNRRQARRRRESTGRLTAQKCEC